MYTRINNYACRKTLEGKKEVGIYCERLGYFVVKDVRVKFWLELQMHLYRQTVYSNGSHALSKLTNECELER